MTARLGGKITASHGSMTETASEVVSLASRLPLVTKISLGEIRHVPKGRRDIKFLPITGDIKAVVRGNGAIQHIYLYTKESTVIEKTILDGFRT